MSKKPDFFQIAVKIGREATHQTPAEECAPLPPKAAAGHKGGLKGGKARAAKLTPEERSEMARKAAEARWRRTPLGVL